MGTKAAALYKIDIPPGESRPIRLRLKQITKGEKSFRAFANFDDLFTQRAREADEFYAALAPGWLEQGALRNPAPGAGRNALEQTILSLHRGAMARGRSRVPAAAGGTQTRPQFRMASSLQRARHVDAG